MSLPILIALICTIVFGLIAIFLSMREEKAKKLLLEREDQQKQRLYEITILKEIQERIGYSLDIEKAIDVITGSLDNLFTFSSVSSMIIHDDKLIFKSHFKEGVNQKFISEIKTSMLASLTALEVSHLPEAIEENFSGSALDEFSQSVPAAYFHIPFVINEKVVGLINVASKEKNPYTEQRMTLLYKIADLASRALSRLEDVLTVEEGKLLAMVGSLADGVFMVDVHSQLTIVNNAAKGFLHIEREHPTIIDVLSSLPNTYDFGGKIQNCIKENKAINEKEVKIGDKTFTVTISPVLDLRQRSEPRVIGASVLLHDITIEQSVAQMKEDFTNIMVHELRSPLTSIKASTELLRSQTPLTPEEKQKLIQLIFSQSNNLLDEVSLILDAAKLESGLFTVRKTHGDLKKLIQDRVTVFFPQAEERFIKLVTDIDPALPNFSFDLNHISQVFNNLISNSLKFTPSGGEIHITAKKVDDKVAISVSDNGSGIPKDKQHLLFSKFSQIATPNAHVGTGLGLYIVKGVIEAHKGEVKLESEEGKGTTISFTLPIETSLLAAESASPFLPASHPLIN